jgi:hypothetical protein
MKKRKKLLWRVVVTAGLLVMAVPTMAAAHEHLDPVEGLDGGRPVAATEKACSSDPRDPELMESGAQLCHSYQRNADEVPTGQERAYAQHLVPEGSARIDQAPAPSDRTEFEIFWWTLGIVVVAGGIAGLIAGLRRRPHALS